MVKETVMTSKKIITTTTKEVRAGSKVQVTFYRSRVQITAPSINYQATQSPLDLIAGCKESQFYSLPFGQAVASMY